MRVHASLLCLALAVAAPAYAALPAPPTATQDLPATPADPFVKPCKLLQTAEQLKLLVEEQTLAAHMPDIAAVTGAGALGQQVPAPQVNELARLNTYASDQTTLQLKATVDDRIAFTEWMNAYCMRHLLRGALEAPVPGAKK